MKISLLLLGFYCLTIISCNGGNQNDSGKNASNYETLTDKENLTNTQNDNSSGLDKDNESILDEENTFPVEDSSDENINVADKEEIKDEYVIQDKDSGVEKPDEENIGGLMPRYKSGSRLKARIGTSPDGAKEFLGWYDTLLQVNCIFNVYSAVYQEKQRCLPAMAAIYSFQDATCTKALAYYTPCVSAPLYAYVSNTSTESCSSSVEYYKIGEKYSGDKIYVKSGENCVETQKQPAYYEYYTVGEKVSVEIFQEMTITVE